MKTATALALALAAVLPAKIPVSSAQKPDIEVVLKEKRITAMSLEGVSLVFYLTVTNPLPAVQFLVRYDYRAEVEGVEYIDLRTDLDTPIRLEPKSETPLALPMKVTYAYLFDTVPAAKNKDVTACFLVGGLTFQDERQREKRTPIAFSAEFPVFRGLEIRLAPIETKALTIGGADLVVKPVLRNLNGFGFTVERLAVKLDLVGTTVYDGVTGAGAEVASRGDKEFPIPLLLDFFEIGRGVYDGLTQPPVAARVEATAGIRTPWGSFSFPLAKSDRVDVRAGF